MKARYVVGLAALLALCAMGGAWADGGPVAEHHWSARPLLLLEGFRVPESVVIEGGVAYVSNIDSEPDKWNDTDGLGSISRLPEETEPRWIDSTKDYPINSPKGLCILDGILYAADNTRVLRFQLPAGAPLPAVDIPGAVGLNDAATDGQHVFVTDTGGNAAYRLDEDGPVKLPAPPSPNGLTFHEGKGYIVSWDEHEVYTFDPGGEEEPVAFGLADNWTNLDGIEVLDDGTILVSDFYGNKISAISPDHREVQTLLELECPADIGLDRERGILWVPQFLIDTVSAYQLEAW